MNPLPGPPPRFEPGKTIFPQSAADWLECLYRAYARNNPIPGDRPIYYAWTKTIAAGVRDDIEYIPPDGNMFYMEKVGYYYAADSLYTLSVDGGAAIFGWSQEPQSESEAFKIFRPPRIANNVVRLRVDNNSVANVTYHGYFAGWNRLG